MPLSTFLNFHNVHLSFGPFGRSSVTQDIIIILLFSIFLGPCHHSDLQVFARETPLLAKRSVSERKPRLAQIDIGVIKNESDKKSILLATQRTRTTAVVATIAKRRNWISSALPGPAVRLTRENKSNNVW